jgi:hypothetical protein
MVPHQTNQHATRAQRSNPAEHATRVQPVGNSPRSKRVYGARTQVGPGQPISELRPGQIRQSAVVLPAESPTTPRKKRIDVALFA